MRVFEPARLGPLELRNRIIKSATYEGMTPGGMPSEALLAFHRTLAAGGVAMTTVAYCAVAPEGRTFGDQLCMRPHVVPGLRRVTDAVHAEGAAASVQLAHCGFFSKVRTPDGRPPKGPSACFNAYGLSTGIPFAPAMSEDDIARATAAFVVAARHAAEAGFDAVELHLGHGYLLSQFISPASNRRTDRFGGSLENRLRFPLEVAARVRDAVGGRLAVLAKINLSDGFRGGLQVTEAVEVARCLEAVGIDAIETSGGFTSRSAFYLLRGGRPLAEMIAAEKNRFQKLALRWFGAQVIRQYPFEEMFFLEQARQVRAAVETPLVLLGGIVSRENLVRAMDDGFAFVALGRALIADPDLVVRMQRGEIERTRCNACNRCVAEMDVAGVRCVLDDAPAV